MLLALFAEVVPSERHPVLEVHELGEDKVNSGVLGHVSDSLVPGQFNDAADFVAYLNKPHGGCQAS